MNKITQTARYRQSLIRYAQKYGVTKAAIRYHTNRQYIYRWMKRYDGTLQSLEDRSHRPHGHAKQHRPDEITAIDIFWDKLPHKGHKLPYSAKKARKAYLALAKCKKWTKAKCRKAISEQLRYEN